MLATTSKRELERERSKGDLSLLSDQMKHGVECFVYEIVLIEYFSGVFQTWASSQLSDGREMQIRCLVKCKTGILGRPPWTVSICGIGEALSLLVGHHTITINIYKGHL
ncbi:hypothetical protein CMV_004777 [Castanea mollissima]|uniref:Uncharacterized protein n=1 Tax=Castanea mollissima TaxID=60419 RepID=A0A8J4RTU6_9ROSI|nr:hypothetical protein CMV_004777 [Castanea mollissima]